MNRHGLREGKKNTWPGTALTSSLLQLFYAEILPTSARLAEMLHAAKDLQARMAMKKA